MYDIDKLILLLEHQKQRGLFYTCSADIEKMLREVTHIPHEITDSENIIERLSRHISKGHNLPFQMPKMYSLFLQISESKSLRWRKNGVIASIYPDVLLSQLKELDKNSKLSHTLYKVYKHGEKVWSSSKKYQIVNNRTCKELLGLNPDSYKEMRARGYIKGKTLYDVLMNIGQIIDP